MQTNNIITFFQKNLGRLVSALVFLATLLFLVDHFFLKKESSFTRDYITAREIFEKILARETPSSDALDMGVALLKKHPSLDSENQGLLSLALLQNNNSLASLKLSKLHIERVKDLTPPLYLEFANTSILIQENNYSQALEQALALEEKLKNDPLPANLRGVNLLRIAFLSHKLDQKETSSAALEKLQHHNFPYKEALFSESTYSLEDFFEKIDGSKT